MVAAGALDSDSIKLVIDSVEFADAVHSLVYNCAFSLESEETMDMLKRFGPLVHCRSPCVWTLN